MTARLKCLVKGTMMMLAGPVPPSKRDYHFRTDADAIADDWKAVGRDMQFAIDAFAEDHHVKQSQSTAAK